ncbi:MAG: RsmB/NOP family class I SAM-dependent RNA methyltransferase [Pseudobdellovibrionaceae bacterium]|nr:RsmB/NOP family class I SAM-dependent RNA methyltransferase [Bdellovibrionales bacterium]USN48969.1 MAG: RsmB/NOP family class I SAM-dependent RNA methyltransferase [Pseudobdellovibrionaceae bacterium]
MKRGPEAFTRYYEGVWGERWIKLKASLQQPSAKVSLPSPFSDTRSLPYELDPASLMPAAALQVKPGNRVLDMCSAPGGKALAMIFSVEGEAKFVLNDLSKQRLSRLNRVLKEQLPESVLSQVRTTHFDSSRWGMYEPEAFDRVLLDAPCSGEQHLLSRPAELAQWSLKRTKYLAQRQYALLCAGVQVLKPGGRLVYSTCTISPLENDQVISKYLKKKPNTVTVERVGSECGEPTEHGWIILPDQCQGQGPIYFSVLQKVPIEK